MEDLSSEELIQLVNFYRQRAADLEFQVLQLQLKLNKTSAEDKSVEEKK
jgi:hypothetical protein